MMGQKQQPLKLPFRYVDTPERRVLDFTREGIPCVPVMAVSRYRKHVSPSKDHVHQECIEICFCQRGRLIFESEGKSYPFLPGSIFISRPNEYHHLRNSPRRLIIYWMLFRVPSSGKSVLGLSKEETVWMVDQLLNLPFRCFPGDERLRQSFANIFQIYDSTSQNITERRLQLRVSVLKLLLEVISLGKNKQQIVCNQKVYKVIREMLRDPRADYTVDQLVSRCGLSPSLLTRAFKQITGLPPHAYLISCRMRYSCEELRTTNKQITEIAAELNFSSSQHFAKTFHHEMGLSPSEWRKKSLISPPGEELTERRGRLRGR